jgi:hypothetical protein
MRFALSNKTDFPGAWNRGKEYPGQIAEMRLVEAKRERNFLGPYCPTFNRLDTNLPNPPPAT